jgi:hypothetical protein
MVEYAISEAEENSVISVSDISGLLSEEGFDMDDSDISKRMHSLSEAGLLSHLAGDRYKLEEGSHFRSFDDEISKIWGEFSTILSEKYDEIYHVNLDKNMEVVFRGFFRELYGAVFESTENLIESEVDPLAYVDAEDIIDNLLKEDDVHKRGVFKETLLEYLEGPTENLSRVNQILYTATINYHILKSGKNIEFESIPAKGKTLFYDTNVLVTMLCKSKDLNPIVDSVTKKSRDLGFEQYYTPETAEELDGLVRMSRKEMDDIGSLPPNSEPVKNEFLEEFYYGTEFDELSGFHSYLSDWRTYLRLNYNIDEYEDGVKVDSAVFEWSKETIREFDKASGDLSVSKKVRKI